MCELVRNCYPLVQHRPASGVRFEEPFVAELVAIHGVDGEVEGRDPEPLDSFPPSSCGEPSDWADLLCPRKHGTVDKACVSFVGEARTDENGWKEEASFEEGRVKRPQSF